jgi:transcriptional regulator with XRE-family HTH domain
LNARIKEIRENEKLTQEEFGKRIGSARNTIANYETGNRKPSNAVITSICREFNINEDWLRNGTGEMRKEVDVSFSEMLSDLEDSDDDFIKSLIKVYMGLDEDSKEALRKISREMAEKYKGQG